jgi:protein TonB
MRAMMDAGRPARLEPVGTLPSGGAYFEFQVEKQAYLMPGHAPKYPDSLRTARVEGQVLAQFVVDTTGRVELGTFKVLKSSHSLFTQAVRDALTTMQFTPAEVGGAKVRQLVQRPFVFSPSQTK